MLVAMIISLVVVGVTCFLVPSIWTVFEKALILFLAVNQASPKIKQRITLYRDSLFLIPQLLAAVLSSVNLTVLKLFDAPIIHNIPLFLDIGSALFLFVIAIVISILFRKYYQRVKRRHNANDSTHKLTCYACLTLIWLTTTISCYYLLRLSAGIVLINLTPISSFIFSLYINLGVVVISRVALKSKRRWRFAVATVALFVIALSLVCI